MRRALAVSVVVVAALAAVGCSSVTSSDIAASVNDVELSQEEFENVLVDPAADGPDESPSTPVDGDVARDRLSSWTIMQILSEDLAARGIQVTDEARETAAGELQASGADFASLWPELQDLLVETRATISVWSQTAPEPTDATIVEESYQAGIAESGIACVAHILVETEAEAEAIVEELAAGGDFATLAAQHTTDSGSAPSGGSLPCTTLREFEQTYTPRFVEAALAAEVGVPTDPVQTEFGYHIVLVRPYDDVADDAAALHDSTASRFVRLAEGFDVHVDPRYGTWDPSTFITPLG